MLLLCLIFVLNIIKFNLIEMSDIFSIHYFAFHKEGICFTPAEEKISYNVWMGASLTVEENVYCYIEEERDWGVTDEYMWYADDHLELITPLHVL